VSAQSNALAAVGNLLKCYILIGFKGTAGFRRRSPEPNKIRSTRAENPVARDVSAGQVCKLFIQPTGFLRRALTIAFTAGFWAIQSASGGLNS
jgi:hypothetical protein